MSSMALAPQAGPDGLVAAWLTGGSSTRCSKPRADLVLERVKTFRE
jgi:hypothetical protein